MGKILSNMYFLHRFRFRFHMDITSIQYILYTQQNLLDLGCLIIYFVWGAGLLYITIVSIYLKRYLIAHFNVLISPFKEFKRFTRCLSELDITLRFSSFTVSWQTSGIYFIWLKMTFLTVNIVLCRSEKSRQRKICNKLWLMRHIYRCFLLFAYFKILVFKSLSKRFKMICKYFFIKIRIHFR